MRTVPGIFKIQRGRIILFSKGCPNPSCLIYDVAAVPAGGSPLWAGRWRSPPCRRTAGGSPLLAGRPSSSLPLLRNVARMHSDGQKMKEVKRPPL
ncbi:hypothetical protein BHE74_00029281 [Ensete ventricosum]|nr:hypothetical protein BHE74_00029281 [Ensete ventricosum]